MTWIVIVLAIAMIVGPVMMIRPSRSQKKQAVLRTQASQMGMVVRLATSTSVGGRGAYYSLPASHVDKKKKLVTWELKKGRYVHDIHFWQEWDWSGGDRAAQPHWEIIQRLLAELPDSISAVGVNTVGVFCLWDERYEEGKEVEALEKLKLFLSGFAQQLDYILQGKPL